MEPIAIWAVGLGVGFSAGWVTSILANFDGESFDFDAEKKMVSEKVTYEGIEFDVEYELYEGTHACDDCPEQAGHANLHSIKCNGGEFIDLLDKSVIAGIERRLFLSATW